MIVTFNILMMHTDYKYVYQDPESLEGEHTRAYKVGIVITIYRQFIIRPTSNLDKVKIKMIDKVL